MVFTSQGVVEGIFSFMFVLSRRLKGQSLLLLGRALKWEGSRAEHSPRLRKKAVIYRV